MTGRSVSVLADTLRDVHLTRLALTDFRCYAAVDVPLEAGVTIFGGANGEGKTNLVEAVGYAATLTSHRAAQDAPLIITGDNYEMGQGIRLEDGRSSTLFGGDVHVNIFNIDKINREEGPRGKPRMKEHLASQTYWLTRLGLKYEEKRNSKEWTPSPAE